MTDKKGTMDKKKLSSKESESRSATLKRNEVRNQSKKMKQMMKKRLIIRNLSFKVDEEKLQEVFSEFGEVVEAKIPLKADGKKRGFAFIRYKDTQSQIKAMKAMNFKEIYGRPIAVDFALSKNTYQTKNQTYSDSQTMDAESNEADSNSETENNVKEDVKKKIEEESDSDDNTDDDNSLADENDEDKKVRSFLKEFDADEEHENSAEECSDDDTSEDEDVSSNDGKDSQFSDVVTTCDKLSKKKQSNDVLEGKTVFIRNVSFSSMEEDLHEIMQGYGETQYCLLCMDTFTDRPKGTAFVKFKEKKSADNLIEESSKDPGILLDGRRLFCAYAISREQLSNTKNESSKVTDKRNLRLLKCSLIIPSSKEAEGVSHTDMAKRAQLEIVKKRKLKNTNFFVSDKRLIIHNIPKNITNKDLAILFKKSAGKGAVIKETRVMRDFKKSDAQGNPASRGFAFVSFTDHEHALKALMELNNNPKIFTSQARPIVEFSVENKVALLSQERRREKMMRNRKKIEEKQAGTEDQTEDNCQMSSKQEITKHKGKRKNKHKNSLSNKKRKQNDVNVSSDKIQTAKSPKEKQKLKKQNKNKNKQGIIINYQDKKTLSVLKNKYKEKLLNKCS